MKFAILKMGRISPFKIVPINGSIFLDLRLTNG